MDGALKFVKGDAVAGIAIVLVNVAGGLLAGVLRGMDAGEAARRYALLAIGDGLVSQIPALLIAVAAGVAVTRVASEEEGATLGAEIGRQLLAQPGPLAAVSALLGALALAPGLPAAPFLVLAGAAGAAAWRLGRRPPDAASTSSAPPALDGLAVEDPLGGPAPVVLELADDLLAVASAGTAGADGLAALRVGSGGSWACASRRWRSGAGRSRRAASGCWWTRCRSPRGVAPADEAVLAVAPDELALVGIAATAEADPLSGRAVAVIAARDAARAAALGPARAPLDRVLAAAAGALARGAARFVGVQEVQSLLDGLEPSAPALVREASRQLPPALLAEVLRRLVEEGVSIRPLRTILEALLEAGGGARGAPSLADAARRALRRHLGHALAGDGPLDALLLDPAAEERIREALTGESARARPARRGGAGRRARERARRPRGPAGAPDQPRRAPRAPGAHRPALPADLGAGLRRAPAGAAGPAARSGGARGLAGIRHPAEALFAKRNAPGRSLPATPYGLLACASTAAGPRPKVRAPRCFATMSAS